VTLREIWRRLEFWSRRARLERDLAREMESHLDLLARDLEQSGLSPDEARAAARRQLGNVTSLRERSRDYWGFPAFETISQDVRYTLRGLRRAPGFAIAVILTLGLGIGANAAIFTVVDRLMFRPIAMMRDPATVHRVYLRSTYRGQASTDYSMEYTRYLDLRKWTTSFSQYAAFAQRDMAVGTGDAVRQVHVATVSASLFDFFDARPALGRWFTTAEDATPRGAEVGVLGYNYWRTQYGGDSSVLGRRVDIDNFTVTIIGVAPKSFTGIKDNYETALYIPITTYAGSRSNPRDAAGYYTRYNWGWMEMMVRRKPGVAVAAANADLSQAYVKSWNYEGTLSRVTPVEIAKPRAFADAIRVGGGPEPSLEARTSVWTIGMAAIVLLIACANVANLFLVRALRRRREIAMRVALGSSRGRLALQSVTESLVLAIAGGALGVFIARFGGAALHTMFVNGDARVAGVDWRTVAFALAAAILTGLVTGVVPAVLSGRGDLASTLKAGARGGTYHRSRLRTTLLVSQGALSVLLLVGAGLFVRSLAQAKSVRIGYDAEPVLIAIVNNRGTNITDTVRLALGERLVDESRAVPGVEAASWVSSMPFISSSSMGLFVAGIDTVRKLGRFTYNVVTPQYFDVMGTRILRGRAFADADRVGAPFVTVVSESMAKVLWPGRDALGQCIRVGADTMPCTTVIGIAENAAQRGLSNDPALGYYLPAEQSLGRNSNGFAVIARVRGDPAKYAETVRKRLQAQMPGAAYVTTEFMRDVVDQQRRSWQFGATVFVALGLLALVVAAVGLYGVISYNVAQRTHEMGVRIALGARSRDVVRLVVGQGVVFTVSGVAIGLGASAIGARWIQPLLFHESARDPVAYVAVGALMLAVGIVASAVPSVRATRADPNLALRAD
jgi:predicted permease